MANNDTQTLDAPAPSPSADLQKMFSDTAGARAMVGSLPQMAFIPVLKSQLSTANTSADYDAEVNKFVDTLGKNPALSQALQKALAEDPTMIDGLKSSGEQDLKAVNAALENPANVTAFTDKLNAIAADPYDNQNFDALKTFLDSTQQAAAPAAPAAADPTPATPAAAPSTPATPAPASFVTMPQDAFIGVISGIVTAQDQSPEMRAAVNDLSQTLKANPALTAEVQKATADPKFMETLLSGGDENTTPLSKVQDLNETLKSPNNVTLFTKTLTAINRDPNDNIDLSLVTKMTELGKKVKEGKATQDDYKAMNSALAGAGVADKRIEMMADPSKIWQNFLNNPEEMVQMVMNEFPVEGMSPEMRNMMAGALTVLTQMASAFVDPNGEFIGHYMKIGKQIGTSLERVGAETMAGSGAVIQEQLRVAGTGAPATASDLGSNIEIDGRRESILSNRDANVFGDVARGTDSAAVEASNRFDAQTREWTQQRNAAPAPVTP